MSLIRVTVNLTPRSERALEQATALTGESKTDAINRAVQIYAYLQQVIADDGALYARDRAEGELERLKLL